MTPDSPTYCLPYLAATADTPAEAVAMAHRSLQRLPASVVAALWQKKYGVYVKASFAGWDDVPGAQKPYGHPNWSTCGGYWDEDIGYAVVNAQWCRTQGHMDAVVIHEFGHALSINVLGRPHRRAPFRTAWKVGRDRIRERWPADFASKNGLGIFTIQWTRAVQETWAECFTWLMGARACTHPAFGEIFTECLERVLADLSALGRDA